MIKKISKGIFFEFVKKPTPHYTCNFANVNVFLFLIKLFWLQKTNQVQIKRALFVCIVILTIISGFICIYQRSISKKRVRYNLKVGAVIKFNNKRTRMSLIIFKSCCTLYCLVVIRIIIRILRYLLLKYKARKGH